MKYIEIFWGILTVYHVQLSVVVVVVFRRNSLLPVLSLPVLVTETYLFIFFKNHFQNLNATQPPIETHVITLCLFHWIILKANVSSVTLL